MNLMKLFSKDEQKKLFANSTDTGSWQVPVSYLRVRKLGYRFLITSLDPDRPQIAYGLCDYDTKLVVQHFNLEQVQQQAAAKNDALQSGKNFVAHLPLENYLEMAQELGTLAGLTNHESEMFGEIFTKVYGGLEPS